MLGRHKLMIMLQGLTLFLLGPTCEATSLGMTVHVVLQESDEGATVKALFSAIAPNPCPTFSGLCAEGEDCQVYSTSLPFSGAKPTDWCVRQWQKTVPSNYKATISLGSNTEFYVSIQAEPQVRANSGRLNQPVYVALPPPLRARVNCPHHFHLSVKDLDGDKVRCRYARPEQGECLDCNQHSFIELDEENCMFTFTGDAPAGQYFIYLMAEDFIPVPKSRQVTDQKPLSTVPVHLSLTVEESTFRCSDEPVVTGETPEQDTTMFVVPYQQVTFNINFMSEPESVLEVAVVGPPELYRIEFKTVGPLAMMSVAWVRSENQLPSLLPICFAANTKSLQSEPRCVWLHQREVRTLPAGTELKCEKTEMTLVLPTSSLSNIDLAELQLNSPTCPVAYNDTHLTAIISLNGCGTKTVHSGSELVYTNTLQSVRPYTVVSRQPSLVLPLACRIPVVQAQGPQHDLSMPTQKEIFGEVGVWIEVHLPGFGPMSNFTRIPEFRSLRAGQNRVRREVETTSDSSGSSNSAAIGSKINNIDLHVMSNCSISRAEMIVSDCIESEMEDFTTYYPFLERGCSSSRGTLEIITTHPTSKVYRIDLSKMETKGSMMYIQCTVNLCITTLPSLRCPDLCVQIINQRAVISSVFTSSYTVKSGPVSLVVTTPAPKATVTANTVTTAPATNTTVKTPPITAAPCTMNANSHAPEQASTMAVGVILTTVSMFYIWYI